MPENSEERRTIRCQRCALNQFETRSGNCRRCGASLLPCTPEPIIKPAHSLRAAELREVGATISIYRMAIGFNQGELAARARTARSFISRLECGTCLPSLRTIEWLAEALRVPMRWLLERANQDRKDALFAMAVLEAARDAGINLQQARAIMQNGI